MTEKHGEKPWIFQVVEMVEAAVHRGVTQLSSSNGPERNASPLMGGGGQYQFNARSREELLASMKTIPSEPDIEAPAPAKPPGPPQPFKWPQ